MVLFRVFLLSSSVLESLYEKQYKGRQPPTYPRIRQMVVKPQLFDEQTCQYGDDSPSPADPTAGWIPIPDFSAVQAMIAWNSESDPVTRLQAIPGYKNEIVTKQALEFLARAASRAEASMPADQAAWMAGCVRPRPQNGAASIPVNCVEGAKQTILNAFKRRDLLEYVYKGERKSTLPDP